jgi:hypothetical protein
MIATRSREIALSSDTIETAQIQRDGPSLGARLWTVVSDLKTQKLESQVMVKLPWYGDTVGQELGLLVRSSFGPPQKLSCPTQSSQ